MHMPAHARRRKPTRYKSMRASTHTRTHTLMRRTGRILEQLADGRVPFGNRTAQIRIGCRHSKQPTQARARTAPTAQGDSTTPLELCGCGRGRGSRLARAARRVVAKASTLLRGVAHALHAADPPTDSSPYASAVTSKYLYMRG
jgi:hypothetical protein